MRKFPENLFGGPIPQPKRKQRRPGWDKIRKHVWLHTSGWIIEHCGHPTANWPYVAIDNAGDGKWLLTPSGRGFSKLIAAQEAVEDKITERLKRPGPQVNKRPSAQRG